VVKNTHLHDFTIDERYSISGNSGLSLDNEEIKFDKTKLSKSFLTFEDDTDYVEYRTKVINDQKKKTNGPNLALVISLLKKFIREHIREEFIKDVKKVYKDVAFKSVKSISVSAGSNKYKIISTYNKNSDYAVDDLKIFEGSRNKKFNSETLKTANHKAIETLYNCYVSTKKGVTESLDEYEKHVNTSHDFNYLQTDSSVSPIYQYFFPSSYTAVVSPSYAKKNNIKPVSQSKVNNLLFSSMYKVKSKYFSNINPKFQFSKNKKDFIKKHGFNNNVI
jgi:YHS domain-containing protein